MNAIGDATMALALFLLIKKAGSVEFGILAPVSSTVATLVALGCSGVPWPSRRQLPLQTWLPDAWRAPRRSAR